jgi:hypothetical protein
VISDLTGSGDAAPGHLDRVRQNVPQMDERRPAPDPAGARLLALPCPSPRTDAPQAPPPTAWPAP